MEIPVHFWYVSICPAVTLSGAAAISAGIKISVEHKYLNIYLPAAGHSYTPFSSDFLLHFFN